MNITFIGAGYVGLVSGTMISWLGHNVTCIDSNPDKISSLNRRSLTLYEPELEYYFNQAIDAGNLHFSDNYESIKNADVVFITVGTPPGNSGLADISYVIQAMKSIDNLIRPNSLVVIKSTVPPTTCQSIVDRFSTNGKYHIASNPEFLREGCAVSDFLKPDRVIIGTTTIHAKAILTELYQPILDEGAVLVNTDLTTAELIKYASNSFLAIKIAFINEMANICEKIDADIDALSYGVGLDHRIGKEFLKAGPGFGGSCFPKDILALAQFAKQLNTDSLVLDAVIIANQQRYSDIVKKIHDIIGGLKGVRFGLLGLAFKAGTDDVRHSPAIGIAELLLAAGSSIIAYDPICMSQRQIQFEKIECAESAIEACKNVDAIIIGTEWDEFKELNFAEIYKIVNKPTIIDLRNILDSKSLRELGFKCYSIGKKYIE